MELQITASGDLGKRIDGMNVSCRSERLEIAALAEREGKDEMAQMLRTAKWLVRLRGEVFALSTDGDFETWIRERFFCSNVALQNAYINLMLRRAPNSVGNLP